MAFHAPDKFRLMHPDHGNNGSIRFKVKGVPLLVVFSDGAGWEHVSVSLPHRCPTWAEMCAVKNAFWDDQDCVVQFHPPRSEYVNAHPFCLHLWRRIGSEFETPPSWTVG